MLEEEEEEERRRRRTMTRTRRGNMELELEGVEGDDERSLKRTPVEYNNVLLFKET